MAGIVVTQWVPEQFASVGPSHKLQVACSGLQLMHWLGHPMFASPFLSQGKGMLAH